MFETEVFRQLNIVKANINEHKTTVAKREITKLIKENPEDFKKFMNNSNLEDWIKHTMKECEEDSKDANLEDMTDIEIVKNGYKEWLTHYERNNHTADKKCEEIILKIIDYYINRYYVIEQVLKINDTESFEAFKNMLRNYTRKHFTDKIVEYIDSDSFQSKSFISKIKKRREINVLLKDLGQYKIDPTAVKGVLQ